MNPSTPPAASEGAAVFGGKQIEVLFHDGRNESITVRLLPIGPDLIRYIELAENESALADYICGKPSDWALTLQPSSLLDVVELAHEMNFSTARRWAEHRARVAAALIPLNDKLIDVSQRHSLATARSQA